MEEPSQFSVGQTAQSLTCPIVEKPHTELDNCLKMLLTCFRKRMSALNGEDRLAVLRRLLLHDAPHLRLQILERIRQLLAEPQGAPKPGLRLDDPPESGFWKIMIYDP